MRSSIVLSLLLAVPCAAAAQTAPAPVPAQTQAQAQDLRAELEKLKREFDALRQNYDQRISILEQKIGDLAGPNVLTAPAPPPAPSPAAVPQADASQTPPAPTQSVAGASKMFNPDMSVIANFLGVAGKNPKSDEPAMQMSEVEMAFQAVVDPYARADFFLSAGPEGLSVEEGFLTFNSLPGNFLLKVGKMRASFGKVNLLHTHAMPSSDRPLVTNSLVGGEDGISDAGFSLSRLIPNSFMFLEATGEVFRGTSNVFESQKRKDLTYVGRLRGYRDLTEGSNLDLGTSYAYGSTGVGTDTHARLFSIDATFRYRPLRRAIYHRFQARTEMVWSRQDLGTASLTNKSFGLYTLGEYQFARRWYAGARYDQSQRALDNSLKDKGVSFFVTYWPSEFSQIRTQYRRTNYAEGIRANEFLFQFNFAIGAHGAHVF
jgi:hypothetical protein